MLVLYAGPLCPAYFCAVSSLFCRNAATFFKFLQHLLYYILFYFTCADGLSQITTADRRRNTDFDASNSMLAVELGEAVSFAPKLVPRVGSPPRLRIRTITTVVRTYLNRQTCTKIGDAKEDTERKQG